ncbi:MAG: choice-of-anchor E domain-containing protein, partial [Candidatus Nanopelagicales bacterium]
MASIGVVATGTPASAAPLPCGPGVQHVTYSDATGQEDVDWNQTLSLTKFNAAGGRKLQQVTLARALDVEQRLEVHNNSTTTAQVVTGVDSYSNVVMSGAGLPALPDLSTALSFPGFTLTPKGTAGAIKYLPGPDEAGFESPQDAESATFSDAATLAAFTGTDQLALPSAATGWQITHAGGNVTTGVFTSAKVTATVTYAYVCSDLTITKTVAAGPGAVLPDDWAFEFNLVPSSGGSPVHIVLNKAHPTATVPDLEPGANYTMTEVPQAGWTTNYVTCTGNSGNPSASGDAFQTIPGGTVPCASHSVIQAAKATITKTVEAGPGGVLPDDWSFAFDVTPAPGGGTPSHIVLTKANPTAEIPGLTPGAAYTITEVPQAGWETGPVTCTAPGGTAAEGPFTAVAGETIPCRSHSTIKGAKATITKTVEAGPGAVLPDDWSFAFDVTPAPGGGT